MSRFLERCAVEGVAAACACELKPTIGTKYLDKIESAMKERVAARRRPKS
jgi:hypothetical protein